MVRQIHDAELTKRPKRASAKKSATSTSKHANRSSVAPNEMSPLQSAELQEKHPRASARAMAFIVRAYENPHYRAAMRDLADR